jgi:hypothetical protein
MSTETWDCTICKAEYEEFEPPYTSGYFGMIPVKFCAECFACMADMVHVYFDNDEE